MLPPSTVAQLKAVVQSLPTTGRDYSERQRGCPLLRLGTTATTPAADDGAVGGGGTEGKIHRVGRLVQTLGQL
jgi:hypothetical protein